MSWMLPWGIFLRKHDKTPFVPHSRLRLLQGVAAITVTVFLIIVIVEVWKGNSDPFFDKCSVGELSKDNKAWAAILVVGFAAVIILTGVSYAAYWWSPWRRTELARTPLNPDEETISLTKAMQ